MNTLENEMNKRLIEKKNKEVGRFEKLIRSQKERYETSVQTLKNDGE